jgi:hypothetical protein
MFEKLKQKIPTNDPVALLSILEEESIEDFREILFFSGGGLVIARSLDGDFVAGTRNETCVWTKDLFVPLSENYPLPLIDFLIQYEHGKIASHILPIIR